MAVRAVVFDIGGMLEFTPRTGSISNSFAGASATQQALYRFDEVCDLIVYSHEVGISKPDRRTFDLACERLGVQPCERVFPGDVPERAAAAAARQPGIHAITLIDTARAIAEVQACLEEWLSACSIS